jgi:CubicO group peptidase (beta-lactamase class C family)
MSINQKTSAAFDACIAQFKEAMPQHAVPGASVGIVHGENEYFDGFGVSNIQQPMPITPDTLMQCGSITKTFVATLMMKLVDMGKLDLDKPVRSYLPQFALQDEVVAKTITVRQLATHTAGWLGDYFADFGWGDNALTNYVASLQAVPQLMPLQWQWSYNNSAFNVAGHVCENVMQQPFERIMQTLIFEPLGLHQSFFFPHDVIAKQFAVGHNILENNIAKVAEPWALGRSSHPAGGLVTTVRELIRYAKFHIHDGVCDGNALISKAALHAMRKPHITSTGRYAQGLAWWLTKVGDTQSIEHNGATNGFTAHLRIVPSQRFAIAILTNSDSGPALCNKISQTALLYFLGHRLDEVRAINTPASALEEFVGIYTAQLQKHNLTLTNGKLVGQTTLLGGFPTQNDPPHGPNPPPVELAFYAPDRVFVANDGILDARGEFIRDAQGKVAWLRWAGRMSRRTN